MKQLLKDFESFAIKGNAIDLAIGVVIGAAFTGVINSISNDVLTPLISIYTGGADFSRLSVHLPNGGAITYGHLIQAAMNFLLIAFILFLLVRALGALAHKKKEDESKPEENPQLKVLMEIRDQLKSGAAH